MPHLVTPLTSVQASFLAAIAEFQAEGRGQPHDDSTIGHEMRTYGRTWSAREGFAEYVVQLRADRLEETPRRVGFVPCTTLWYVDGDQYFGRLAIRHRLTESLRNVGGHIGYDVRPTARRRGYATAMLGTALPYAADLGIERALLTCDVDNMASRSVIERNGGRLEGERDGKLRFWIDTGLRLDEVPVRRVQ